jgi:hypothetical protein
MGAPSFILAKNAILTKPLFSNQNYFLFFLSKLNCGQGFVV